MRPQQPKGLERLARVQESAVAPHIPAEHDSSKLVGQRAVDAVGRCEHTDRPEPEVYDDQRSDGTDAQDYAGESDDHGPVRDEAPDVEGHGLRGLEGVLEPRVVERVEVPVQHAGAQQLAEESRLEVEEHAPNHQLNALADSDARQLLGLAPLEHVKEQRKQTREVVADGEVLHAHRHAVLGDLDEQVRHEPLHHKVEHHQALRSARFVRNESRALMDEHDGSAQSKRLAEAPAPLAELRAQDEAAVQHHRAVGDPDGAHARVPVRAASS